MDKRKKELDVDFIGGEQLTRQEKAALSKFFRKKKKDRFKNKLNKKKITGKDS